MGIGQTRFRSSPPQLPSSTDRLCGAGEPWSCRARDNLERPTVNYAVGRRTATLDALVEELRRRYGPRAARRGAELPAPERPAGLATGCAALDAALPAGGLPRGALTELSGPRSAGATSLALAAIRQAQAMGDLACLLDLSHSFAPAAAVWGMDRHALAIARPATAVEAALVVQTLLARRAVGILVLDSLPYWLARSGGVAALAGLLRRLPRLLAAADCVLLVLNPRPSGLLPDPPQAPLATLAPVAALRLQLANTGWLRHGPAIIGCTARVEVCVPPRAEPAAVVQLELPFAGAEGQR